MGVAAILIHANQLDIYELVMSTENGTQAYIDNISNNHVGTKWSEKCQNLKLRWYKTITPSLNSYWKKYYVP